MKSTRILLPILVATLVLMGVFRLWVPTFLSAGNLWDLGQQVAINAILALGLTLVILIGGIDLSVGAVVALVGTVTVALLPALGLAGAVAAGLAVAGAIGGINGLCAAFTPMPPFIITLATMQIARGLALRFNEGRPLPIPASQETFLALGNGRWLGVIPVPLVVTLGAFLALGVLLHRTRFGQHLYAIGGNREAARYTGIPVRRNEVLVYLLCAMLAGLAGLIHASQLYSAEPASGQGFELNAIAAVVVGGTSFTGGIGSMPGTLLGATLIGVMDKGLNQSGVHFSLQYIIKGLVILAAVFIDARRRQRLL
jgi:ribose transport system permease protein